VKKVFLGFVLLISVLGFVGFGVARCKPVDVVPLPPPLAPLCNHKVSIDGLRQDKTRQGGSVLVDIKLAVLDVSGEPTFREGDSVSALLWAKKNGAKSKTVFPACVHVFYVYQNIALGMVVTEVKALTHDKK
jgi:hypothetical protein